MNEELEDIFPVTVKIVDDDWVAVNEANGEVSKYRRQSSKEAFEDAKFLFQKWKHLHKCFVV